MFPETDTESKQKTRRALSKVHSFDKG